jgi:tetratricopeptide (TPR) repeat protein
MPWWNNVANVTDTKRRAQLAEEEGAKHGAELLKWPAGAWRRMMRNDARYRSYGTLKYLLGKAREKFSTAPSSAQEITATVLLFVDEVDAPSVNHAIGLRGLARKEHANACLQVGELREALAAAELAVDIYGQHATLVFEQTFARLVVCKVLREMGEVEKAMDIARQCVLIFEDFGNPSATNMARMFEAGALFSLKRFPEALQIFMSVMGQAELEDDKSTVAKCLLCGAACAREIGDLVSARDLYPRALALYEELNIRDDANRVRWGLALTLSAEGKPHAAISELFKVRAVFLSLGMNTNAACASLDVVRIRFDLGEDVRDLCSELVVTFTDAGMTQNAIEALAYLREEARLGTITRRKIDQVRTYFDDLAAHPILLFARPFDGEEG